MIVSGKATKTKPKEPAGMIPPASVNLPIEEKGADPMIAKLIQRNVAQAVPAGTKTQIAIVLGEKEHKLVLIGGVVEVKDAELVSEMVRQGFELMAVYDDAKKKAIKKAYKESIRLEHPDGTDITVDLDVGGKKVHVESGQAETTDADVVNQLGEQGWRIMNPHTLEKEMGA